MKNWIILKELILEAVPVILKSMLIGILFGFVIMTYYEVETVKINQALQYEMLTYEISSLAEMHEQFIKNYSEDMKKLVLDFMGVQTEINKSQYNVNNSQTEILESIVGNLKELDIDIEEFYNFKNNIQKQIENIPTVDLKNVDKIKEANVLIINITLGCSGSGTHIKINNQSYILTVAHLIDIKEKNNNLQVVTDEGNWSEAELVKINVEKDLALLKVENFGKHAYLEISEIEPKEGSKVYIIGNPNAMTDIITDGIIAKIENNSYYYVSNKIWFGNSGGCLIYNGKITGVISQIYALCDMNSYGIVTQNYGIVVSLKEIKNFLKDFDEKI